MDIPEMLDRCKKVLKLKSDYALAKALEINQARLTGYRTGKEHPDTYVCFRIAEILGESPTKIIASVEAKTQRNERKSLYFQRYFTIAALWITLAALSVGYSTSSGTAYASGNIAESPALTDIKAHYAKWKRRFKRWFELLKMLKNERYFTCNWTRKAREAGL